MPGPFPLNSIAQFVENVDLCSSEDSDAPAVIVAGAGLDNSKVTGQTIDRKSGTALAHSLSIGTSYLAGLDDGETISLAHEIQESANGSDWDSAEVIEALTVEATQSGAGQSRGISEHAIDLMDRKRFFRINVTLDLSRGATDEATFHSVGTLGGWNQVPQ